MFVPMPAGRLVLLEPVLGDHDAVIVDEDGGF
jgi:hypothetical protein